MKPEMLDSMREARDFPSLTRDLLAACAPFGPVHSFKLVHNPGAGNVACIIELDRPKEQPALARALGGRTLNGSVCLEIPVRKDFEARPRIAA